MICTSLVPLPYNWLKQKMEHRSYETVLKLFFLIHCLYRKNAIKGL